MGAISNDSTESYVGWEEMVVYTGKGRREVHYFLKRRGGGRDLVVVGRETNARDMTYDYTFNDGPFLFPILNGFSGLKLRTRKEVVDWMDSMVSVPWFCKGDYYLQCRNIMSIPKSRFGASEILFTDLDTLRKGSLRLSSRERYRKVKREANVVTWVPLLNHSIPGFAWLGLPSVCQKRRRHYQSFCRNGSIISIRDFVYVLSDDYRRLVAYIEDMYEDVEGNKMVLVRWFHKIDEVGIVLPSSYNDKEIFYSLCLQDISVECIDGIATILCPEHYEKLRNEATRLCLNPFMCSRQFDNGDLKPFEVTALEGYWNQEFLKKKGGSLLEISLNSKREASFGDAMPSRPTKRYRLSHSSGATASSLSDPKGDNAETHKLPEILTIGSCVEVLSQDSGIRGCWFRAVIIKKHKDSVKLRYQGVKDAEDESKYLEEWIAASRIAAQDLLGIRLFGRTIIRPSLLPDGAIVYDSLNIGSIVDAWWHDGWWEGIVLKKESRDRIAVYFPGERKESVFSPKDLRHSKEWIHNCWKDINPRPDLALKFCSTDSRAVLAPDRLEDEKKVLPPKSEVVSDLSKDGLLRQLRWISSGKKRNRRSPVHRVDFSTGVSSPDARYLAFKKFIGSSHLKFDVDNCKNSSGSCSELISPFSSLLVSM